MLSDNFNINEELIKAVVGYLIPALLLAFFSFIGPLADFIWVEVLRTWRGIVCLIVLIVGYFIAPALCAWIALAALSLFVLKKLLRYRYGPKLKKSGFIPIVFAGFYQTTANGKLIRTGQSILLDTKFLTLINELLQDHRIQERIPIRIYPFKPPGIIHSRHTFESFGSLMRRYAATAPAVMWGVVDEQGRIRSFEVTSFEQHYAGGKAALKFNEDIARVILIDGLNASAVAEFLANAHAAMWGHAFCDILNHGGQWQASFLIAMNSRRLFERALKQLHERSGNAADGIIEFLRKRLLPLFITQEAIGLKHGGNWELAIDKLCEAITLCPLWPAYDENEFTEFYNNRYALTIASASKPDNPFAGSLSRYERLAMVDLPPNLQMLLDWLHQAPDKVQEVDQKIDKVFSVISAAHPNNCYVLLYWADAFKVPGYLKNKDKPETSLIPLHILNKVIKKFEDALKLCPNLPVIPARLSGIYLATLQHFEENTPEFKRRLNKAFHFMNLGKMYYTETLPQVEGEQPWDITNNLNE